MRSTLPFALVFCGGLAGCGDDDLASPPLDLQPPPDLAPYPDLVPSLGVGMPCPNGNECMGGLICLNAKADPQLPTDGYCTKSCGDDPNCGAGAFCGPPLDKLGKACWLRCGPNDTCASPRQVCSRSLGGLADLVNRACIPGNPAARDGSSCKNFGDCNKNQACINNPFDFPGGYCVTVGCTPGDNTTCAPGGMPACLKADNTGLCFAGCMGDGDCRINEGYKCLQPPNSPVKVCVVNNPLGGHCKMPKDCGNPPWNCIVDMNVPNGLCTIIGCDAKADTGCPTNGHCVDVGNGTTVCLKGCGMDGDCAMGTRCQPVPGGGGAPVKVCAP